MLRLPKAFLAAWTLWLVGGVCFALFYHQRQDSAPDFLSFYAAGDLALHQPSQLYSAAAQQAVQDRIDPSIHGVLPFKHLSYEALLLAPFTALPFRAAYVASVAVNMQLLLLAFLAAPQVFSRTAPYWQPRPGLQMFFFLPLAFVLMQGQDSLLLLVICCLVLRSLVADQPLRAGAILALALFKFQIALPLFVLLVVRRGWRVAGGFLPVGLLLAVVSVALTGLHDMEQLRSLLVACTLAPDSGSSAQTLFYVSPALMPTLMGLVATLLGSSVRPALGMGLVALLSAAVLGFGARIMRRLPGEEDAFGVAILCTILVSYHLYLHDAVLLLIPLALWCSRRSSAVALLAPLPLLLVGSSYFCLLTLPMLWMLIDSSRARVAARPQACAQLKTA